MYGLPKSVCVVPVIPVSVSVLLSYVLFVFLYVGSYLLIQEFDSWITGVCSPYVISLSDFAYYVFGQEHAVAMHLALWYVVLVCHQYDVCENYVGSVYVGGYGGLSESGLCVFRELCPVSFLVVGESTSVLL